MKVTSEIVLVPEGQSQSSNEIQAIQLVPTLAALYNAAALEAWRGR